MSFYIDMQWYFLSCCKTAYLQAIYFSALQINFGPDVIFIFRLPPVTILFVIELVSITIHSTFIPRSICNITVVKVFILSCVI